MSGNKLYGEEDGWCQFCGCGCLESGLYVCEECLQKGKREKKGSREE